MKDALIKLLFHTASYLPLRVLQGVGRFAGWLLWVTDSSRKRVALRNLEACFPELTPERREAIAREALKHEMMTITELPLIWLGPHRRVMKGLKEIHGLEKVEAAIERGRGLVILTLHMGSFEGPAVPYSDTYVITGLYKPQKGAIEELSYRGRTRNKGRLLPAEKGVFNAAVPLLKENQQLYFLPDQDPRPGSGVYVPFFGVSAHTPRLIANLLRETDAAVLYLYGERLPRAEGFVMHISEASPEIYDDDTEVSAAAMNRDLENIIRSCPEQYWWGYRRFRRRPKGEPDFYAGI